MSLLCVSSVSLAMQELGERELAGVTGQALLVADTLDGVSGSGHTFHRMMLDAKVEFNMNIDRLQLGCGGYNEATAPNACDIDIENVRLMGLGAGQPGASGAGDPATSLFKLNQPYIELAIKNDQDPTLREVVGFKIGAALAEGYFGLGEYREDLNGCDPSATGGQGAFMCHRGINRISGFMNARMQGEAYGCFALFGCSTDGVDPEDQDLVARFDQLIELHGTRLNRAITQIEAQSNPDETLGLNITVGVNVNEHLRFMHGFAIDPSNPQYDADDFFLSFQREQVRYPTFEKSQSHSAAANPGWWMNVPLAELKDLKAYDVEADGGNLFVNVDLIDADIGQRPPDNCFGSLTFC